MKRSTLAYKEWTCIKEKKQTIQYVKKNGFSGYLSQIDLISVTKPQIWKFHGEDIVVCKSGYHWFSILPADENYCITAMMDQDSNIILWYIDMIAGQGLTGEQIPYFDDLYLDLVVYPDGTIYEDDRDELEDALNQGDITSDLFDLANRTCTKLKEGLLSDIDKFIQFTYALKGECNGTTHCERGEESTKAHL